MTIQSVMIHTIISKTHKLEERIKNVLNFLKKAIWEEWYSTVDVSLGFRHTQTRFGPWPRQARATCCWTGPQSKVIFSFNETMLSGYVRRSI